MGCYDKIVPKMHDTCEDTVGNGPSGSPCFILARCFFVEFSSLRSHWEHLETQWKVRPINLHFYLGITQNVSATLKALPKTSPKKILGHFLKDLKYSVGAGQKASNLQLLVSTFLRLSPNKKAFVPFSLKYCNMFTFISINIKDSAEKFENHQ